MRLDYHVRPKARWPRTMALGAVAAALLAAGIYDYVHVLLPRWRQARLQADLKASFDEDLAVAAHRTSPVAAIVDESLLRGEPALIEKYGSFPSYEDDHFQATPDGEALQVRLLRDPASARLFQHRSSTVFLGRRTARDGREYIVALDVGVEGRVLDLYGEFIDPRAADAALRTVSRASGTYSGKPVATFSFADDPAIAFVLSGAADPLDPSAFSFDVIHGGHRDTARCVVGAPGTITLGPVVEAGVEDRWRVSPASRAATDVVPSTRPG